MSATVTLDKTGRVVIPKTVRDELHLDPADALELESEGECLTLRPIRSTSPMRKKHGIWVFCGGNSIPAAITAKVGRDLRAQRDRDNRNPRQ